MDDMVSLPKWRHVKRGSVYEEVCRAEVQIARPHNTIVEGDTVVIYRGEDGRFWARHESEFGDGRFECLEIDAGHAGGSTS